MTTKKWRSKAEIREAYQKGIIKTDEELEKAISSIPWPPDITRITDKLDQGFELTPAEDRRLEQWESSPDSGLAGSIMGGGR